MNSAYTTLTIGGLVLMMVAAINANRLIVSTDLQPLENVHSNQVVAFADGLMGEIRTKRFDEVARDTSVLQRTDFSVLLGPEEGSVRDTCSVRDTSGYRSTSWYNDVDDYNGYVRVARIADNLVYEIKVDVTYVTENSLIPTSERTYLKKITVSVRNRADEPPILALSTIRAY